MSHTVFDELADQFDEVYPLIQKLRGTLARIEPGGTLDDIVAKSKLHGDVYMAYTETPPCIAIEHKGKRYIFRVIDV